MFLLIKLTSSSLLSVPVQRRSSSAYLLSVVSSTCPPPPPPSFPPPLSPSLCRDFDRPKVSLKVELFNSVSCLRRWLPVKSVLRDEDVTMRQSICSVAKGTWRRGTSATSGMIVSPHTDQGKHIMFIFICINLPALILIGLALQNKYEHAQLYQLQISSVSHC